MTVRQFLTFAGLAAAVLLASGCTPEEEEAPEAPRLVRVVTVEPEEEGRTVSLTGTVEAKREVDLAFRVGGRMTERPVNVGDMLEAGTTVARLDPINEQNALLSANANLAAAEARLVEAQLDFDRQSHLYERNVVARARLDNASQVLRSAQSAVDDAQARSDLAQTRLDDTELRADAPGTVIARGAEIGEIVQPGQMIVRVARDDGRDAVFDAPANLMGTVPPYTEIGIALTMDPAVTASGRIREVSPQADATTGTFRVRVGLDNPPPEMRLGSTVTGQVRLGGAAGVIIPATALTSLDGAPAVWVVDPATSTVALRPVEVAEHRPSTVIVATGLQSGELVVTAGVQALRPGQAVRLPDARS
ncbi:efflux RND transporter periplasmic adaptor subunit [Acuticoccus sp. M5D2P5]|uniref:efflux RND transporter periplasmic adaptor subunit n=1 Tax=Acuticoccus kalidii TaxID=2910977 RepID=UPI001F1FA4EF|nr:efflux RND transporter periplasmic adaptor subunit [Acuticoccus kalidii]MCF3935248.1 efflux RND transporter periplasmic adaptor subunit [Acuticoccus kalidii]